MIPKLGFVKGAVLKQFQPVKSTLEPAEIAQVLDYYDFGKWKLGKELGGGNSDNIILHTEAGDKVFKRYHWSLETIIQEHSILKRLFAKDNQFPSPRLAINKDSNTVTQFASRHYGIYDYVSGFCYSHYYFSPKNQEKFIAQAASMLARFHATMKDFIPDGKSWTGLRPDGEKLWRGNEWLFTVLDEFYECGSGGKLTTDQEQFILNRIEKIRDDIIRTGKHYEFPGSHLPQCVIHGDYAPHNILFEGNGIKNILDFGGANLNLRVADISRALSTFTMSKSNIINSRLARVFLSSYNGGQPLLDIELTAILDIMVWTNLRRIVWTLFNIKENVMPAGKSFRHIQFQWERIGAIKTQTKKLQQIFYE